MFDHILHDTFSLVASQTITPLTSTETERLLHAAEVAVPAAFAGAEYGEHRVNEENREQQQKKDKEEQKRQDKAERAEKAKSKQDSKTSNQDAKTSDQEANVGNAHAGGSDGFVPAGFVPIVPAGSSGKVGGGGAIPMVPVIPAGATGSMLEAVTLPDGRTAYLERPEPASGNSGDGPDKGNSNKLTKGKKDKPLPENTAQDVDAPANHTPGAIVPDIGKMHCPMCCPSAPRDALGRPVYHCVHQSDSAGPGPMDHAKPTSMAAKGKKQNPPAPEAIVLPPGDNDEFDVAVPPPSKLKKGKGQSNPEEEMEDARKLASE